jgi:hypothetical protein
VLFEDAMAERLAKALDEAARPDVWAPIATIQAAVRRPRFFCLDRAQGLARV